MKPKIEKCMSTRITFSQTYQQTCKDHSKSGSKILLHEESCGGDGILKQMLEKLQQNT